MSTPTLSRTGQLGRDAVLSTYAVGWRNNGNRWHIARKDANAKGWKPR